MTGWACKQRGEGPAHVLRLCQANRVATCVARLPLSPLANVVFPEACWSLVVAPRRPMRLAASGPGGPEMSSNTATDPRSSRTRVRPSKIEAGSLVGADLRTLVDPARAVALQHPEVGVRMAGVGRLVPVAVGTVVLHDDVGEVF